MKKNENGKNSLFVYGRNIEFKNSVRTTCFDHVLITDKNNIHTHVTFYRIDSDNLQLLITEASTCVLLFSSRLFIYFYFCVCFVLGFFSVSSRQFLSKRNL